LVSLRVGRRYCSAALQANAVHFASDLAGSVAVLGGLLGVRAGWKEADSAAALFVAVLVLAAAARLMRRNVDVLMDRVPSEAHAIASRAIGALEPPVQLRRLRMRQAGGRQFADVVIGVPPGAAVGEGHAAADAVEAAVHDALPESDVVVHVEPQEDETALRERTLAAAQRVPQVREIHNLSVLRTDAGAEVSLHLKLPADLSLEDAHAVASEVEQAIAESMPEVSSVQTHLEPLAEPARGTTVERDTGFVEAIVRAATGTGRTGVPDEWYELPVFYFSNPAAIYGPDDEIPYPAGSEELDYELEVAAVIGVAGAVGGFTVMNDWSARDLQRKEMKIGLGPAKGKDFATSLGPIVVTPDELGDLRLEMVARVNGEERSRGNLGDMYHSWEAILERAAANTKLVPGDVIGSGTVGSGCILEHGDGRWLQPGDTVELEVEGIGVLRNRVGPKRSARLPFGKR